MKILGVVLILISFSVAAQAQPNGRTIPDAALIDVYGRPVRLANYKGNVVLLNFWATWCPPCRTEIPALVKLQRTYRRQGLRIIGITYPPETQTEVLDFAHKVGIDYPLVIGDKETRSLFSESETLPISVVIDREGAIRGVIEGIMYSDEFDEKVKPLLVSPRANTSAAQSGVRNRAGLQKARIEVNGEGYQPVTIHLKRGMTAQLTFVRTVEESCGREIVIPAYGINRPLPMNKPVTVTFTPKRSGRFKFTCGMDMFRGALVVK
jgi:thiol-disulfide isomerase/thioredoxin